MRTRINYGRRGMPRENVARMYSDYLRLRSLAKTAARYGITRQSLYEVFNRRGLHLPGRPSAEPRDPPATPVRGGPVAFDYLVYQAGTGARSYGCGRAVAYQLVESPNGEHRYRGMRFDAVIVGRVKNCKPKRSAFGLLWRGKTFYWSNKGYYRYGYGHRHPIQIYIWEFHSGQKWKRNWEIWFKDRDSHNFEFSNLEFLPKEEVQRRIGRASAYRNFGDFAKRSRSRRLSWQRKYREQLSAALQTFNQNQQEPDEITQFLQQRKTIGPGIRTRRNSPGDAARGVAVAQEEQR